MLAGDVSHRFGAALADAAPTLLNTLDDLMRELRLPISGTVFVSSWSPLLREGGVHRLLTCASVSSECMPQITVLLERAFEYVVYEGTEEVWASTADLLTGNVLSALDRLTGRLELSVNRNAIDPSGATLDALRPDWWALCRGALLAKAEHKRTSGELNDAISELATKMHIWNPVLLRGLPFLPCYAVGGPLLRFCALSRDTSGAVRVDSVSPTFNMNVAVDRVTIVTYTFNLFRCMVSLRARMPEIVPVLYVDQVRPNGVVIRIYDDYVIKLCTPAPEYVYAAARGLPFAVTIDFPLGRRRRGGVELRITPVCVNCRPNTEAELKAAISCVLIALNVFHMKGYVHRDVRWPNVLLDGSRWLLADFELSEKAGEVLPVSFRSSKMSPEANSGKPVLSPGDMWQVGMLVVAWARDASGRVLSEDAAQFVDAVMSADPEARLTAQAALAHRWLR